MAWSDFTERLIDGVLRLGPKSEAEREVRRALLPGLSNGEIDIRETIARIRALSKLDPGDHRNAPSLPAGKDRGGHD